MAHIAHLFNNTTLSGGLSYFDYEYQVAQEIVIPWLNRHIDLRGKSVGDFGCHQGGILQAFRELAHIRSGRGYDLNADSIRNSPFIENASFSLNVGDILALSPESNPEHRFDVILIRDVLEHIPDYTGVLIKAYTCLNPGGHLFISFPPYYSPFGGHQQLADNWAKLMPYLHYLPESLLFNLVQLSDNNYMHAKDSEADMRSVRTTRLTLTKTEKGLQRAGLQLVNRNCFLLRPEFKIRYGLPSLSCDMIGHIPILKEVLTMGVYYLAQKPAQ